MAKPQDKQVLFIKYLDWCKQNNYKPLFLHFPDSDIELFNEFGFKVNQIGACYGIDMNQYSMAGKKFQQLRYKINKAKSKNIIVEEIHSQKEFHETKPKLIEINDSWLKKKKAKPIHIMVTDFDSIRLDVSSNRLFVARFDGEIISYILYSKTFGDDSGWFHNLSRHKKGAPDGSMQLITKTFMEDMAGKTAYLHFGFTPLVEMGQEKAIGSNGFKRIAEYLSAKGGVVYPARSQRQYKMSWRPTYISPEYFAYNCGALSALLSLLFATNSI